MTFSGELLVGFSNFKEWHEWKEKNQVYFKFWQNKIINSIKSQGFEEPITGIRRRPREIQINENNLRESISCEGLNSRKRAVLFIIGIIINSLNLHKRKLKILDTEALTRSALILRGTFPYYLGTEYLPTENERNIHYPIPHMDLHKIEHPSNVFDCFISCDVFEHLSELPKALREIFRILKEGGIMISTFPFLYNHNKSKILAILNSDGSITHLEPPEYHGNPIRPEEGSLVFIKPAWDILDLCKETGFSDAKMILVASSKYGITSNYIPGVFVLLCCKNLRLPNDLFKIILNS